MSKELSQRIAASIQEFSEPIQISRTMRPTQYELDGEIYPVDNVEYEVSDTFEIPNLNDEWMIQEENPEEVDRVIEGWIEAYQQHFVKPTDSTVATEYGITESLRPKTARMMAYAALSQDYSVLVDTQRTAIENLEAERVRKRNEINEQVRDKKLTKGLGEKRRQEGEQEFKRSSEPYLLERNKYKTIHDYISRKFIFEQFSGEEFTDDFNLTPESFASNIRDISNIPTAVPSLVGFINRTADYVLNSQDRHLLNEYSYKNTPTLSKTLDDTKALSLAVSTVLDRPITKGPVGEAVKKLGESYLSFITQQAFQKSKKQTGFADSTPVLATLYDLLNSTLTLSQYPNYRDSIGVLIEKTMGSALKTEYVRMEAFKLTTNYIRDTQSIIQRYSSVLPRIGTMKFVDVPQPIKDYIVSDTKRLFDGMYNALGLLFSTGKRTGPFLPAPAVEGVHNEMYKSTNRHKGTFDAAKSIERNLYSLNNSHVFPQLGVSVDLVNNLASYHALLGPQAIERITELIGNQFVDPNVKLMLGSYVRDSQPNKGTFAQRAKEIRTAVEGLVGQGVLPQSAVSNDNFLREYSFFHISTPFNRPTAEALEYLNEETREVWFQLLNTSKWFVSPRGDSFLAQDDPELRENEIDSVIFRVDTRYPREHKVELQLEGMNGPIELWLDTNERLLNSEHQPLTVDATFKVALTNLLIKRLCFITSGVLAGNPRRREYEFPGYEGPNFTYRRANYHVLVNDRYTMTSSGVNTHAEEIYDEYGIDIFDERDRRRRLGVIGPTDHLTFNRESTPDIMPEHPRPNVVIYKPELLTEYLNRNRNATMQE